MNITLVSLQADDPENDWTSCYQSIDELIADNPLFASMRGVLGLEDLYHLHMQIAFDDLQSYTLAIVR